MEEGWRLGSEEDRRTGVSVETVCDDVGEVTMVEVVVVIATIAVVIISDSTTAIGKASDGCAD